MIFCKKHSVLICSLFLIFACTSKKTLPESSKETLSTSVAYGITPIFIYHNTNLLQARKIDEDFNKVKEFIVSDNIIKYYGSTVVDLNQLDKNFSYLIDYFKEGKKEYLLISEVNSDHLESSSDFNTLSRSKLFICNLSTQKKYKYVYTSNRNGLILPRTYYERLGYGITIKSIDTGAKLIVFEKDKNKVNTIRVPIVEVTSF